MSLLADRDWRLKYTPEDGDLLRLFYVPALEDAVRYDRLTGYFSAPALSLAARGIEGLVRNDGRMRLVVGCTLDPPEIEAIERGESLRKAVESHLVAEPLDPPDDPSKEALELLAWMVAKGILEVKVAIPCDEEKRPIPSDGIFHEKAGIVEDRVGDRLAWNGSLNETARGWRHNWESINVYRGWEEPARVNEEEGNFARLWAGKANRVILMDVPGAVRQDLLRFLPEDDRPARLKEPPKKPTPEEVVQAPPQEEPSGLVDLRKTVWGFIKAAPSFPGGGDYVGEATAAVSPWPHQVRAFQRLYVERWPPNLLVADEVGLGKTIEAGFLLRQAWLSGRAGRILILAPKAVLRQWQIELREKFNLNWPIYDGKQLCWHPSPALRGRESRPVGRDAWHREPVVIASSHLMRRRDRARELLEQAEPWDLVILDEAHHARRRAAGASTEGGPNALLRLMRELRGKATGLVLLTATPMQVHPVEVWDLLSLLGLPPEWSEGAFLQFFDDIAQSNPSPDAFERMAHLFQAAERHFSPMPDSDATRLTGLTRLKAGRVLRALRDSASIPRRQLSTAERQAAIRLLRSHTPIRHLISRNTRELLRRYHKAGMLTTPIADRVVEDRFIEMTPDESALYASVEDYISTTYNRASAKDRNAVGFVMTIYRRRLASSFRALERTLQAHLDAIGAGHGRVVAANPEEDAPDDEVSDEPMGAEDVTALEQAALQAEERGDIKDLLRRIKSLPADTKVGSLRKVLSDLRSTEHAQVMVFTQFTDTMDFLRDELGKDGDLRLLCFSGRGGEARGADGGWVSISRDEAKRRFREGLADVLLCTEAAAEGLNFQFCGALVNFDMPWNPMRVEQRIGRIDRLGQRHPTIRIVNLHYEGTVETDVYRALRSRIGLFTSVIGRLQPILSSLPGRISTSVLGGASRDEARRAGLVSEIEGEVAELEQGGFDLDAVTDADLVAPERPGPLFDLDDLDLVMNRESVMPQGVVTQPLASREYAYQAPGMAVSLRVTTDRRFYEEHADSVELWSPGSPLFPEPEEIAVAEPPQDGVTLRSLLTGT